MQWKPCFVLKKLFFSITVISSRCSEVDYEYQFDNPQLGIVAPQCTATVCVHMCVSACVCLCVCVYVVAICPRGKCFIKIVIVNPFLSFSPSVIIPLSYSQATHQARCRWETLSFVLPWWCYSTYSRHHHRKWHLSW